MQKIICVMLIGFSAILIFDKCLAGPIFPTRTILIHPRWHAKNDSSKALNEVGFWSSVTRGYNSNGDRFGWDIMFGGSVEFARWGESSSLYGLGSMELNCDTHNNISFNPRGIRWEEGIMFAKRGENIDWQAGMLYRCRHDIDNSDTDLSVGRGEQRTLIYSSLLGKIISHPFHLYGQDDDRAGEIRLWTQGDLFIFREDYRLPGIYYGVGTTFQNLAFSVAGNANLNLFPLLGGFSYVRTYLNLTGFGSNNGFLSRFAVAKTTLDTRTEIGYQLEGTASRLQLYGGYESIQDDGATPLPKDTQFAFIGFRLTGLEMTW